MIENGVMGENDNLWENDNLRERTVIPRERMCQRRSGPKYRMTGQRREWQTLKENGKRERKTIQSRD